MKRKKILSGFIMLVLTVNCFAQSGVRAKNNNNLTIAANLGDSALNINRVKAVTAPLTYSLLAGNELWPADKRAAIIKAMDEAVAFYNKYGYFVKTLTVEYNTNVPTADANYNGRIRFGGSISTRTAMHEISHTLGVGTTSQWAANADLTTNTWKGAKALALLKLYNAQGVVLKTDKWHFWSSTGPSYGLNFENQDGSTIRIRHVRMVSAFRWDMGIVKDSDNDGLPDDWEMFHFGTLNYNGNNDNDSDGKSNLEEYNADTNPTSKFEWVKVDDRDAMVTYDSNWARYPSDPSYNTTTNYSNVTGATATFSFTGTQARYYGFKRNNLGYANIYINNVLKASVDCYAPNLQPDVLLFESDTLAYGSHTLKVVVSGQKNPSSSKTEIICDAFEYFQGSVVNSIAINKIESKKLKVYPNPAKDKFTIYSPGDFVSKISIFDTMGRKVFQNTFKGDIQISTDEIQGSGIFCIHLSAGNITYVDKLIKD